MKSTIFAALLSAFATAALAAPGSLLSLLEGKELADLEDSGDYTITDLGDVVQASPVPSDGAVRHYHVSTYTAKSDGVAFTVYASYLDEEDGGNTYGWIEDAQGTLVAAVADSFIDPVDQNAVATIGGSPTLAGTPRLIAPALDLKDTASVKAYLTQVIREYEKDAPDVEVDLDAQPCLVTKDAKAAVCTVNYLQDRWNGTLTATLELKDGQAVKLAKASFEGNF